MAAATFGVLPTVGHCGGLDSLAQDDQMTVGGGDGQADRCGDLAHRWVTDLVSLGEVGGDRRTGPPAASLLPYHQLTIFWTPDTSRSMVSSIP